MATIKITKSYNLNERQQLYAMDAPSLKLNDYVQDRITLEVYGCALLEIETEDRGTYVQYALITSNGEKFTTGSEVFGTKLFEIMEAGNAPTKIDIYKIESKKHPGQKFITCCASFEM